MSVCFVCFRLSNMTEGVIVTANQYQVNTNCSWFLETNKYVIIILPSLINSSLSLSFPIVPEGLT